MPAHKPRRSDDALPPLPPLDGDGDEVDNSLDDLLPFDLSDDGGGLDDAAAGEGFDDALPDAIGAGSDGVDDLEGPTPDDDDDAEDIVLAATVDDDSDADDDQDVDWLADEAPARSDDRGEEGPDDPEADLMGELPPLDDDADGDAPPDEEGPAGMASPGRALEGVASLAASVRLVRGATVGEGVVLGVAVSIAVAHDGLWAVGDAVARLDRASFDDEAPTFSAIDAPGGEVFTGVAVGADGTPVVATLGGQVLVATRRGSWKPVSDHGPVRPGPVRLHFDGLRVWCVDAQGALSSLDGDGARHAVPGVVATAVAVDREGGLLVLSATGGEVNAQRREAAPEAGWQRVSLPAGVAPTAAACAGDLVALSAPESGWVSTDGGRRWHEAPALGGATALAVIHSDDGAPGLLAGLYDAATDRAVVLSAPIGADGALGAAQHVALPAEGRDDDEAEGDGRIEQLVALDPSGRQLAVLTGRGAVWRIDRA